MNTETLKTILVRFAENLVNHPIYDDPYSGGQLESALIAAQNQVLERISYDLLEILNMDFETDNQIKEF